MTYSLLKVAEARIPQSTFSKEHLAAIRCEDYNPGARSMDPKARKTADPVPGWDEWMRAQGFRPATWAERRQHDRLLGRPTIMQKAVGTVRWAGSNLIAWIHRRGASR
jgi:hypothetical protein